MINNIQNAAKYLGISSRTVIRMINEGIFPEPVETMKISDTKVLRCWKEEDLDAFRKNLRPAHRPKSVTKSVTRNDNK